MELELQTRYLVQAAWASSGYAKPGQVEKAVAGVRFLPASERPRQLPSTARVMGLMPPSVRTQIRNIRL